jgi:diguanylate cyclase (GGDEF)-like protein/PAS domain S-box-containing protein
MTLHPLLQRQLRVRGIDPAAEGLAVEQLTSLLDAISRSYGDVDQERYLLERSQDLASREMADLNTALRVSEARLASLLSLSSDWVWEQDSAGRFAFVSDDLQRRTGIDPAHLLGRACTADGELSTKPAELATMQNARSEAAPFHDITFEVDVDGHVQFMRISGAPILDGATCTGYRGVGSDVTDSVLAERKILELARYDVLTGLPNRTLFMEEIHHAIGRARRSDSELALMFVDLDRFKHVNDGFGHAAGDHVLQTIAGRLRSLLRDGDILARLGGDEFVVIAELPPSAHDLGLLASRMITAASEPVPYEGHRLSVSASVGIASFPSDGDDGPSLLRAADAAMYLAKANGRKTFEFFTEDAGKRNAFQLRLERAIETATAEQQWVLHWQPVIDTVTGRWIAAEGLIRWQHPQRGLLMPSVFIEAAEQSGQIVDIGRWVIGEACRQYDAWRATGIELDRCSVNLSVRQLDSHGLVDDIEAALAAFEIAPHHLELEVTESFVMGNATRALATLDLLHELGVQLAVDDFGTGYSSLGQLKRIPAQTLKIDRTFIGGLPTRADDLAITRAVAAMGHSLGMRVIAEGVETVEQQMCLEDFGVRHLQGYLFAKPLPAEEATELLAGTAVFSR